MNKVLTNNILIILLSAYLLIIRSILYYGQTGIVSYERL